MPKALTDYEKCRQCERLLQKGRDIVLSQGLRKISVDNVTKAAGMAKGSFYQHFETKEEFVYKLTWNIYWQLFAQVEQIILSQDDLQTHMRDFLVTLFNMPELIFFIKNSHEISDLFDSMPNQEIESANQQEVDMYEKLLKLAGIDTEKVKPGVVHNYLHTLFLMMGSDLMIKKALPETFDQMINSLVAYICGNVS
jgi:AcrR family transcriptional regulator